MESACLISASSLQGLLPGLIGVLLLVKQAQGKGGWSLERMGETVLIRACCSGHSQVKLFSFFFSLEWELMNKRLFGTIGWIIDLVK